MCWGSTKTGWVSLELRCSSCLIVGRDKLGDISEHEDFLCVWVSLSLTCGQETTHAIGACISTDDLSPATCHMYNMCHSSLFSWLIGRHIYTYKHAYMYRACMILVDNYKKGSGRHARRNCSVPHASIYPWAKYIYTTIVNTNLHRHDLFTSGDNWMMNKKGWKRLLRFHYRIHHVWYA